MTIDATIKNIILESRNKPVDGVVNLKKKTPVIETIHPIPKVKDTLLYYKIDLFYIHGVDDTEKEKTFLKVSLRTEDSVRYNYEEEDGTDKGTRGFKYYKSSLQTHNRDNQPSVVIHKKIIEHPFYVDVIAKREQFMKKYKKHDMFIKPYLANMYEPNHKNQGKFDFCSSVVAFEKNLEPEVYIRMGDWEFHDSIPLYSEKKVNGKDAWRFSVTNTLRRDFNPKRRTL